MSVQLWFMVREKSLAETIAGTVNTKITRINSNIFLIFI